MTIYISGPITGLPRLNKPAFAHAAEMLRLAGHAVLNPHEIGEPSEDLLPWESYLRADLIAMLQQADRIALLPGWELSRGARLEYHVATALGWEVRPWKHWLDETRNPAYKENRNA